MATTTLEIPNDIIASSAALKLSLESVKNFALRDRAIKAVRGCFSTLAPETLEAWIQYNAQAQILGESGQVPDFKPTEKPTEQKVFENLAMAWILSTCGQDPTPYLQDPGPLDFGGGLTLMMLSSWRRALLGRDNQEVSRQLLRAIELGRQYQIEGTDSIEWVYCALVLRGSADSTSKWS